MCVCVATIPWILNTTAVNFTEPDYNICTRGNILLRSNIVNRIDVWWNLG